MDNRRCFILELFIVIDHMLNKLKDALLELEYKFDVREEIENHEAKSVDQQTHEVLVFIQDRGVRLDQKLNDQSESHWIDV